LLPKTNGVWFSSILTMALHDEDYSRDTPCAFN